jgi:hypothetical protein
MTCMEDEQQILIWVLMSIDIKTINESKLNNE